MEAELLIRGGTIVTPEALFRAEVAVAQGRIIGMLAPGTAASCQCVIDAGGLYLMPGLIDAHVHLREPGLAHKETITSGTQAAACGGVTTVLDMPNTLPPVTSAETLLAKAALVPGRAHVDVGFYALLASGCTGHLNALIAGGCMGFKLFLGPTTGDLRAPSWGELLEAFATLAKTRAPVVVHAESREIIEHWIPKARATGDSYDSFLASRPEYGEVSATEQVCRLAGATGASVHIAHVALAQAVQVLRRAKREGWPVTAETCPGYLFLTADHYPQTGPAMKILPPIRHRTDQMALWQGLADGDIDLVATDHAPHLVEEKEGTVWDAAAGAPGVETLFPLMLDAARRGQCTLSDVALWCSAKPAALFGLRDKGRIKPGAWADLVLVDAAREWTIQPERLHSISHTTPFRGWRGRGAPALTLLRGVVVAREGEPVGCATGRWVRPQWQHER